MTTAWLNAAIERCSPLGFRGRVVAAAATAAAVPFGLLVATAGAPLAHPATTLAIAATLTGWLLFCVSKLLTPVGVAARAIHACATGDAVPDLVNPAGERAEEIDAMMVDIRAVAEKLNAVSRTDFHSTTALPSRKQILAEIAADLPGTGVTLVLGAVRLVDYHRLAAFDHKAAERALKAFALRLRGAVQQSRPVAHIQGSSFAVWFRGEDPAAATAELQALTYVLGQDLHEDGLQFTPEVEIGVARFPVDGDDAATLLTRACASMRKPRRTDQEAFFTPESSADARERFTLEQDLRHAIDRGQFELHYQPVVDLVAGQLAGAEALVRWRHPERGLIPPIEFVPILEETGQMDEAGLWILNAACREARLWEDRGLKGLKMAVNLSARQLRDPALKATIVRTLELHQLKPQSLELELTETAAMEDMDRTLALFSDLQALGVNLAIDDFGSGYSSLSYVKRLPFDKLKIDREFVTNVDTRRDSQAICRALIELTRGLEIRVLAEGVETREEVETLRSLGCAMFQGYYFGRPLTAEAFAATVRDPNWLALLASPVHRELAGLKSRIAQ